ncbi:MAG: cell division protein FtsZ, partial [Xanthobacteraceae bacterium]
EKNEPARYAPPAPPAPISVNDSIESAKLAVAAAILPQGPEVTIRPIGPKPTLFVDPATSGPEPHEPEAFIPPQPERLPGRGPRMPRIDELPVPAQNEIRARRGEVREDDHPEKRRMSLLQRLASVGLGRRDQDESEAGLPAAPVGAPVSGPVSPERLTGRPSRKEPGHDLPVSEYARRSAPQGLDQHGRQAPVHNSSDEDQLDIPAFLRRQAK